MMPPTSIDGTDINGATIDGTDVTEITVDGDVVFSSGAPIPGTLVSEWFNNEGSGTTASDQRRSFDATWDNFSWVSGAGPGGTHVEPNSNSSEGGQITGGLSDWSHFTSGPTGTIMAWINRQGNFGTSGGVENIAMYDYDSSGAGGGMNFYYRDGVLKVIWTDDQYIQFTTNLSIDQNEWYFVAMAVDSSSLEIYKSDEPNFTNLDNDSFTSGITSVQAASTDPSMGGDNPNNSGRAFPGKISVFAKTDVKMTQSEIEAYRDATKPDFP